MSHTRRPVIAGNWKMHNTAAEARDLAKALGAKLTSLTAPSAPEVVICPPFTALAAVSEILSGTPLHLGAQNMNYHPQGAFTGEIAPGMLKELGVTHVILGHSERRQLFGETDAQVNLKLEAALANDLIPIVCVGETLQEREASLTDTVIIVQVQRALGNIGKEKASSVIFAYEPVWAIGTGKTCEPAEANRVCHLIRETIGRLTSLDAAAGVRVLYGGSVKPETIASQMAESDIDGALVGGASLDAEAFVAIVNYIPATSSK